MCQELPRRVGNLLQILRSVAAVARAEAASRAGMSLAPAAAMVPGPPVPPTSSGSPKLLDRVRAAIQLRHYSRRTEESYLVWIRRFIVYHGKRHPSEMGAREITAFLSHLAVRRHVSSSTQNQALSAIIFLYNLRGAPRNLYYV